MTISPFEEIKGKIFQILMTQEELQIESNKLDFYAISQKSEDFPGDEVPIIVLLSTIEPLSTEDVKKLPVRLNAALNEKTKPILQSVVELSESLIAEKRAITAHQWGENTDTRGKKTSEISEEADKRAVREEKIRFRERIVEQSARRTSHKESILDMSYSNIWNDIRTQVALKGILGVIALRADVTENNNWGRFALWAPIATSLTTDIISTILTIISSSNSLDIERENVSSERLTYETANRNLAGALYNQCPTNTQTSSICDLESSKPHFRIENGKPSRSSDVVNARRLPPFTRVGQYLIPFVLTGLSAIVAGIRQDSVGSGGIDPVSINGTLNFNGSLPEGPFNLTGTFAP